MQQRWKASWVEAGRRRVAVFESIDNRKIARIDFRLLALANGIRPPEHVELEECEQQEGERAWPLTSRERRSCTP
jgi:hypothetical protein